MGYMTDGLTFNTLRGGNIARLPQFKNKRGEIAHAKANGSDWSLSEWVNATMGEMGELSECILALAMVRSLGVIGNATKKLQRGDLTLSEVRALIAKELPDVLIYADLLAFQVDLDLGQCVIDKFNEVSIRVGSTVRLAADDWHHVDVVTKDSGPKPTADFPTHPKHCKCKGRGYFTTDMMGSAFIACNGYNGLPCDGNHGGSVCADPQCWKREPHPPQQVCTWPDCGKDTNQVTGDVCGPQCCKND